MSLHIWNFEKFSYSEKKFDVFLYLTVLLQFFSSQISCLYEYKISQLNIQCCDYNTYYIYIILAYNS